MPGEGLLVRQESGKQVKAAPVAAAERKVGPLPLNPPVPEWTVMWGWWWFRLLAQTEPDWTSDKPLERSRSRQPLALFPLIN